MGAAPEIELLLVDPDADFRQVVGDVLQEAGYTVAEADDEDEAERLLSRSHKSPLILLNECYSDTSLKEAGPARTGSSPLLLRYHKPVDIHDLLHGIREQLPEHC
jgi:hypothetical protein